MEYTVTWKIQVDAETPREAAKEALAIQRDTDSIATRFRVRHEECNQRGCYQVIDLWTDEPE